MLIGNELLKSGKHQEAIQKYTEGIANSGQNKALKSILYTNRAVAYSKLEQFINALADCNRAIATNDMYNRVISNYFSLLTCMKAYLRRAEILILLGYHSNAKNDTNKAYELNPGIILIKL